MPAPDDGARGGFQLCLLRVLLRGLLHYGGLLDDHLRYYVAISCWNGCSELHGLVPMQQQELEPTNQAHDILRAPRYRISVAFTSFLVEFEHGDDKR